MLFCRLLKYLKIHLFQKLFQKYYQSVKQFSFRSWVQTVGKVIISFEFKQMRWINRIWTWNSFWEREGFTDFDMWSGLTECGMAKYVVVWLIWFCPSQHFIQSCREGSSWVEPVLSRGQRVLLKNTMQCLRWGLNTQPLSLKSSTLPLSHSAPLPIWCGKNWSRKTIVIGILRKWTPKKGTPGDQVADLLCIQLASYPERGPTDVDDVPAPAC